jgi:Domain of unknown function DUF11
MNNLALNPQLKLTLLGSSIIAALLATPVSASILTVNDLGGTTVSGDVLCTLPEAVNNAEANSDTTGGDCTAGSGIDTIKFKVSGNVISGILPEILDPKGLTIDGSGQTVALGNGARSTRNGIGFITVRGGVLHLKNLTVTNVKGTIDRYGLGTGGAMSIDGGIVTISNCTFSDNYAQNAGGIANYRGGTLTIANSLFTENRASRSAGAISNGGKLTIINSIFSNNRVDFPMYEALAGAIGNSGTLSVMNSTFSGNIGSTGGGGIFNQGLGFVGGKWIAANATIINSTFKNNSAKFDAGVGGGGIYSGENSNLTVINSTFSGNVSSLSYYGGGGGAIHSLGNSLNVINSTFSNNISTAISGQDPDGVGGILFEGKGSFQLANTLLADNTGGDCKISIPLTANLNNLIKDSSCNPAISGDPKLGLLTNNGGPTQTFALLTGSPALDAGNDAVCKSALVNNRDQRGVIRPKGKHCDIGAFEAGFADLSVSIVDTPDPVTIHNRLTWTVIITNSGIVTATGTTFTEQLPSTGYKLMAIKPSQGNCNAPTLSGSVLCNLGNIANGKTATVKLVLRPTHAGRLNTTAKVKSNQFDNHWPNNKASQSTKVIAPACRPLRAKSGKNVN